MLTLEWRELEADGIVKREAEQTVPIKVQYSLTDQGKN
jgi:DNA-binding HxlR family transcriptional regulator